MPLHQARKAIKNEEQYGFVFSDVLLTVDELFEKGREGPVEIKRFAGFTSFELGLFHVFVEIQRGIK